MRIYYLNEQYEPNKHIIVKVWIAGRKPEDSNRTKINSPYSVLEIDEEYNSVAFDIARNYMPKPTAETTILPKYYVNDYGQIVNALNGKTITINPNPRKEAFKLSQLYGLTQEQLENYIDNNVTNLVEAKEFLKKLSAVVLWLIKQSKLG